VLTLILVFLALGLLLLANYKTQIASFALLPLAALGFFNFKTIYGLLKTGSWNHPKISLNSFDWFESIQLNFFNDETALILSSLVLFLGFFIFLYSYFYFKNIADRNRFLALLSLFTGAMLGVISANHLILLFVFWELTSIVSYFLIAFHYESDNSRHSAQMALLITGIGGLAMLAGFLILGNEAGSYLISDLSLNQFKVSSALNWGLALVFLGALTKSAQFPFHFWLPNAMTAPTPASSFLHSATMVKAGVFLLLRLHPVFSQAELWSSLKFFGAATLFVSACALFFQKDLKKILAYTTTAALGILVFFLGFASPLAVQFTFVFIIAHAFYKAPLFLLAGNIEQSCHGRDITVLARGLREKLRLSFWAVLISLLGLSAVVPQFNFYLKEAMLEFLMKDFHPVFFSVFVFSAITFVFTSLKFLIEVFFQKEDSVVEKRQAKKIPLSLELIPLFLALSGFFLGLFPALWNLSFFQNALMGLTQSEKFFHFHWWAGFHAPLFISLGIWILGALSYFFLRKKAVSLDILANRVERFSFARLYFEMLSAFFRFAKYFFSLIQNGNLPFYIFVILSFTLGLLMFPFDFEFLTKNFQFSFQNLEIFPVLLVLTMCVGALMALRAQSNLAALTALGFVGFGLAFIYLLFGAPDLALTQFLVETLTLVLLVLCFRFLPKTPLVFDRFYTMFTGGIAAIGGGLFFFLAYESSQSKAMSGALKKFFSEESYVSALGKNVVNVILVDFRGIDTLGEIIVLCLAAVGVYTLLKVKKKERAVKNEK